MCICFMLMQHYNASRYTDRLAAASQSYDDLTERIEQALRISASGLSANCNTDESMVQILCILLKSEICHFFVTTSILMAFFQVILA